MFVWGIMKNSRVPLIPLSRREKQELRENPKFSVATVEFDYEKAVSNPEEFELHRQEIYAADQMEALKLQRKIRRKKFKDKALSGMEDRDLISLYKELRMDQKDKFEQERLEKGQSTKNVALIVAAIRDIKMKEAIDE